MKKIYYVGYCDDLKTMTWKRMVFPAANTKMEYIISAFQKCEYDLKVLSASLPIEKGFLPCETRKISKNTTWLQSWEFGDDLYYYEKQTIE